MCRSTEFLQGGYGGGGQKKIGGDLLWILQYLEWPQWWPQIGTTRDAPVQHVPKNIAGDQDHRQCLFAGVSGLSRHFLRSVQPPPQGCGYFLQRFNVLCIVGTSIARPKCCQITASDGRAPLVCGGILTSTARRLQHGWHSCGNCTATPGARYPYIQGI